MGKSDEIRRLAQARGIEYLLHFTPAQNACSILENGLAGRSILDAHGVDYVYTDAWRLDGIEDGVSLSITDVNHAMLRAKRRDYPGPWLIVGIDPSVLWTHECRFCWHNAASREMTRHTGYIGGPYAFRRMFESRPAPGPEKICQREKYGLEPQDPTDNAAEVQVRGVIDPELIIAIGVQYEAHRPEMEKLIADLGRNIPVEWVDKIFRG